MDKRILEERILSDGRIIRTYPGTKGPKDFILKATSLRTGREMTPKHAHFVIDFYGKICSSKKDALLEFELIGRIYQGEKAKGILSSLSTKDKNKIASLPGYNIEYILNCLELIFKQEELNYPSNKINPRTGKYFEGKRFTFGMFEDVVNGTHPVEAMKKKGLRI